MVRPIWGDRMVAHAVQHFPIVAGKRQLVAAFAGCVLVDLVFESMNSTGLDLETSDLVRNYMLMGCSMAEQKTLYEDYWLPMERVLGNLSFDAFLHDWMVVTLKKPVLKGRVMYAEFKRFAADSSLGFSEQQRGEGFDQIVFG